MIKPIKNINFNKLRNKKVLITGASGLVGIHLLASLKEVQNELNITIYTWTKNENSFYKEIFENCTQIVCDITDINNYKDLPKFDFIIHAAGYGQPIKFLWDKIKTIEINTHVTIQLLELLKDDGIFLYISSSEVYNGLFKYGITEDEIGISDSIHPRASYIEAKKCGEVICNVYREKGKNVKIARLSTSFGPGTKYGDIRVVSSLIDKGLKNDTIELLDDGNSLRTLCYITDVIEMLFNIGLNSKEFIYNVGGIETISILELANKIGFILNKEVLTQKSDGELIGSPKLVNLSIDKYIREFNKNEFVSIDAGLLKTIEWQKTINNETN